MSQTQPRVGLFATCLVDAIRPNIGLASAHLLEQAGCRVEVPTQSCCGGSRPSTAAATPPSAPSPGR